MRGICVVAKICGRNTAEMRSYFARIRTMLGLMEVLGMQRMKWTKMMSSLDAETSAQ